ncbi:MAG: magnesium transporter CorA [Methylobacterium sp.]|uniref:CorA family divalent cation transporter n=1 Tax=Methylobacterium sp. TaxID=409 RepID=UPI0025853B1D|nr:CorA family divalent cation transporter [Methylobacterium sp.]MBY0296557.1 magnesium transporter CorA [Methylobacterium sp.]
MEHRHRLEDRTPEPGRVWIDLAEPDEAAIARTEALTGLALPSCADLREVERSSRLRRQQDALVLSTPMVSFDGTPGLHPLGFVLARDRLVTLRFQALPPFAAVARRQAEPDGPRTSTALFGALLAELVDALADRLEAMSDALDALSGRVFDFDLGRGGAPKRRDRALRQILGEVGRSGKALSMLRAALLGLGRIVPFVAAEAEPWLSPEERTHLEILRLDIVSLEEFETRLSETVQFLLDATLGLVNMEQNNTFRVLTVVSVIGIPPTLVASIYGMNFKTMPELDWTWGYPYGLALIALSALAPALYFRVKGWF